MFQGRLQGVIRVMRVGIPPKNAVWGKTGEIFAELEGGDWTLFMATRLDCKNHCTRNFHSPPLANSFVRGTAVINTHPELKLPRRRRAVEQTLLTKQIGKYIFMMMMPSWENTSEGQIRILRVCERRDYDLQINGADHLVAKRNRSTTERQKIKHREGVDVLTVMGCTWLS